MASYWYKKLGFGVSEVKQAQVTELAILGIGGSTTKTMQWDNFFKIILAHAKLIDHGKQASNNIRIQTNATQTSKPTTSSGRGGGSGSRSGGRGNPSSRGNSAAGRGRYTSFTERVLPQFLVQTCILLQT